MKTAAAKSNVVAIQPKSDAPRPNMRCMCCGEPIRSEKGHFAPGHERRAEGFLIRELFGSTANFVHQHRHLLPKDGLKSVKEAEIVRKQERAAERDRKAAEAELSEGMAKADEALKSRKTVSEKISESLESAAPAGPAKSDKPARKPGLGLPKKKAGAKKAKSASKKSRR